MLTDPAAGHATPASLLLQRMCPECGRGAHQMTALGARVPRGQCTWGGTLVMPCWGRQGVLPLCASQPGPAAIVCCSGPEGKLNNGGVQQRGSIEPCSPCSSQGWTPAALPDGSDSRTWLGLCGHDGISLHLQRRAQVWCK